MADGQQRLDTGELDLKFSKCRSCSAQIVWCRTERGKKPLDAKPLEDIYRSDVGAFVLRDRSSSEGPLAIAAWGLEGTEPHYISHFATCPNADQHRSRTPMRVPCWPR